MSAKLDTFWANIDRQISELGEAKSADDVIRICPPIRETSSGDGFFEGSGGDQQVDEALREAGWTPIWWNASYYWAMRAPDGSEITYIEGDLYRGNRP